MTKKQKKMLLPIKLVKKKLTYVMNVIKLSLLAINQLKI